MFNSKPFLTFLLIFIFKLCFSQNNYKSGEIVTLNGETIKGQIDDREWVRNPTQINFIRNGNSNKETYNASEIAEFLIEDRLHYQSHIIRYDNSPYRTEKLNFESGPDWITDTVFLQCHILGYMSLFSFNDINFKTHFFLSKNQENPFELIHRFYLKWENKNGERDKVIMEKKEYIGQLNYYFADCLSLKNNFNDLKYKLKALKTLIKKYHQCQKNENKITYIEPRKSSIKLEFHIVGGYNNNTLKASGHIETLDNQNYSSPTIGVGLNFSIRKKRNQFSINNELLYKEQFFSHTFEEEQILSFYTKQKYIEVDVQYLIYNLSFKHTIPTKIFQPFYHIGLGRGFSITASAIEKNTKTENATGETETTTDLLLPILFAPSEFHVLYGIGVIFRNKFELEMRGEIGNGFTNGIFTDTTTKTRTWYLLAKYYF